MRDVTRPKNKVTQHEGLIAEERHCFGRCDPLGLLIKQKAGIATTRNVILALKVILLDRLQGINCSGIQEP